MTAASGTLERTMAKMTDGILALYSILLPFPQQMTNGWREPGAMCSME